MRPWFGKNPERFVAWRAGLRAGHIIVAVGGESPDLIGRPFMTWFRMRYNPGDEVVLTVKDGARQRTITYRLPE